MVKQKNVKFRTIEIILYEDSRTYEASCLIDALESVANELGYRYYYITHDKDKGEGGSILKSHIHFLLYTTRNKELTLKKLANLLGYPSLTVIPFQYKFKNNIRESVKYLCHESNNSTDKYHYDYHDIITNDSDYVLRVYNEDIETTNVISIIEYIDNREDYIRIRELTQYVLDNNLWSVYRRNISIIKSLMDEHNFKLSINS